MNPTLKPLYRMPAEWEPHASTWLAWPHRTSDWPGKFAPIRYVYAEIIRVLSQHEHVHLVVGTPRERQIATRTLQDAHVNLSAVSMHLWPTDRSWLRDSGPIFARRADGGKIALDWRFNAWAKYDDWKNDDRLPQRVAKVLGTPTEQPEWNWKRVVLEGGSIDVNGAGCLLTTEECLLSQVQERNPHMNREDYEACFRRFLGAEKTLWIDRGIAGDDTHGHIDDLARFVNPSTIVAIVENNPVRADYRVLQENLDRLRGFTDVCGKKFTVATLPTPEPVRFAGQHLPASYANFYIANEVVIVPTFNDPADRIALGTLAELFPKRKVVGIHCVDLILGLGTLHCMSQQEPA